MYRISHPVETECSLSLIVHAIANIRNDPDDILGHRGSFSKQNKNTTNLFYLIRIY